MWDMNPERIVTMIDTMASKHKGQMLGLYFDWRIESYYHPAYEVKIEQPVPLLVIDFK